VYIYIGSARRKAEFLWGSPLKRLKLSMGAGGKLEKKILNKYSSPCQEEVPGRPQLSWP